MEEEGILTLSNPMKKAELQEPLVEGAGTALLVPLVGVVLVEGAETVLLVPLVGVVLVDGAETVLLVVPVEGAETVNIVDPPWGEVVQGAEVPWTAQNAEWGV